MCGSSHRIAAGMTGSSSFISLSGAFTLPLGNSPIYRHDRQRTGMTGGSSFISLSGTFTLPLGNSPIYRHDRQRTGTTGSNSFISLSGAFTLPLGNLPVRPAANRYDRQQLVYFILRSFAVPTHKVPPHPEENADLMRLDHLYHNIMRILPRSPVKGNTAQAVTEGAGLHIQIG